MNNKQKKSENNTNKSIKSMKISETKINSVNQQLTTSQNQYDDLQLDETAKRKKLKKPIKAFGIICVVISIASFIFIGTSKVDTSQAAKSALENKISTEVSGGTILLSKDENIQGGDYTITHNSDVKDTKILIWDYAAEDGDYVQVIVNGTTLGDSFMIKHKPKEITVPAVGKVEIKGIRDGGGGITYAIRYDINGTSYFNGTLEGESNTYTLIKE